MRKGGDALIVEIWLSNSLIQKLRRRLNLDYFKQELLNPTRPNDVVTSSKSLMAHPEMENVEASKTLIAEASYHTLPRT